MHEPEQTPLYVGSSAARLLVALTVFLVLLGGGALWLSFGSHGKAKASKNRPVKPVATTEATAHSDAVEAPAAAPLSSQSEIGRAHV